MKTEATFIKIAATWLLVLMLAIAAAIITITVVNETSFGPQKTVHAYLDALKAGNGPKALGLLNARVPGANAAVLDGPSLADSQRAVKDVTVGEPKVAPENRKTVTLSYTINGAALTTDFTLEPGPKHWMFFDSWRMVPSTLPVINASVVNANQASINGVEANMPAGKNSFAVFYPGSYTMEYQTPLFASPPVTRTVTGPHEATPAVALTTQPTSELLRQVDGTIHQYLDACAKQHVLLPTNCPMSAATNNRVTSTITWSVLEYPQVSISPFGGQWVIAPLKVKAEVKYQQQDLFTGIISPFTASEDFGFTAKMSIAGTTVTVTPVVSY